MAEQGTFLGEVQRGFARFWGLPWKWKGPVLGFLALVVLVIAVPGTEDDTPPASADVESTATPGASQEATTVPSAEPTAEPTETSAATNTPAPTNTPEPTATPKPTATPTPPPTATPTPQPIVLSGTGQSTAQTGQLGSGIWLVDLSHSGGSNFAIWAYDSSGGQELLVNEIGNYTGRRWLAGNDDYLLDISAGGSWTLQLSPINTQPTAATSLSGNGDFVSGLFSPTQGGPASWRFEFHGQSNFAVWLQCDDRPRLVQNEIGAVSASTVVNFSGASLCFWDVTAHGGTWSFAKQ